MCCDADSLLGAAAAVVCVTSHSSPGPLNRDRLAKKTKTSYTYTVQGKKGTKSSRRWGDSEPTTLVDTGVA